MDKHKKIETLLKPFKSHNVVVDLLDAGDGRGHTGSLRFEYQERGRRQWHVAHFSASGYCDYWLNEGLPNNLADQVLGLHAKYKRSWLVRGAPVTLLVSYKSGKSSKIQARYLVVARFCAYVLGKNPTTGNLMQIHVSNLIEPTLVEQAALLEKQP